MTWFTRRKPSSSAKAEDLVPIREIPACAEMTVTLALAQIKPDALQVAVTVPDRERLTMPHDSAR